MQYNICKGPHFASSKEGGQRLITLNDINRSSSVFTRGNLAPSFFINKQDHTTFFSTGWDDLKGRFEHLRMYSSGLANAFANTTSVESDFSIMKWEKYDF
jgi:hypothetical protein